MQRRVVSRCARLNELDVMSVTDVDTDVLGEADVEMTGDWRICRTGNYKEKMLGSTSV